MSLREIHQTVQNWLITSGASFEVDQPVKKIGFPPLKVNFLVVSPYPFIVQIFSETAKNRSNTKRQLANRLLIGETFSPYLPVIVIGPDTDIFRSSQDVRFADAHFMVDQLPEINELPRLVNLNPFIQDVFAKGSPKNVSITEGDRIGELWETSLSLRDFATQQEYSTDTLARKITDYVENKQQGEGALPLANYDELSVWIPEFDNLVTQYVTATMQGQFSSIELHMPVDHDQQAYVRFQGQIWRMPSGKQVYLKTLKLAADEPSPHQALELLCDAWLLRSNQQVTDGGLILLLHPFEKKVKTFTGEKVISTIDPISVNSFEMAGWKVFPWDFNQETPAFIKYLQNWGKR